MSGEERFPGSSPDQYQSHPIRGSRAWAKRVLELIDRDRIEDFEELCVLMDVPSAIREYPPTT